MDSTVHWQHRMAASSCKDPESSGLRERMVKFAGRMNSSAKQNKW